MTSHARFTHMQDGSREDWAIIAADFSAYARQLPGRILAHLRLLDGDFAGFPVDRLTHSREIRPGTLCGEGIYPRWAAQQPPSRCA